MDTASNILVLVAFLCSGLVPIRSAKWSYEGDSGPLNWHELFPHACSGRNQSPVDLRPEETMYNPELKDFAIWYDPPKQDSRLYIKNNGHTVQIDLEGDFFVTNGGLQNVYKAVQFHFHWGHKAFHGSEHLIDSKAYPIELHIVSYNYENYKDIGEAVMQKDGLAVLGVLFKVTPEDNPVLDPIIRGIKHVRDPEARTRISLPLMSIRNLLPEDISRYYRYNGSLTTPGCFESVTWTVFDTEQTISHTQLREFRTLLQFKHKHKKHTSGSHSKDNKNHNNNHNNHGSSHSKENHHVSLERHRRSLTHSERVKERRAMDVLDELGITGDEFEQAVLKAQLLEKKQRQLLMADDPYRGHHPTLSEERAAKIDRNIDAHVGHQAHESLQRMGALDAPGNEEPKAVFDYEYTQDILVNNFRPVQPINGRIVYRSFKLRQPQEAMEVVHASHSHSADHASHGGHGSHDHHGKGRNKASTNTLNMASMLVMTLLAYALIRRA